MADLIVEEFEIVGEMSTDPAGLVPLDPQLVERVTRGDSEPQFATFQIDSGWSKSRRYWGADLFQNVAEQINSSDESIVGYLGHIQPELDPYVFPEIQFQWLRAKAQQASDRAKLFVKAYVLPGVKARDYLTRGLAKTVSWRGEAITTPYEKGVRVKQFNIESIDLSRPRKAGMNARLVGALTSEMEEEARVKPEEIAALQENELRAHNPTLVSAIEGSAKKPLEDKVSEMSTAEAALRSDAELIPEIRKLFGMDENADVLDVLKTSADKLREAGKTVRDSILDSVLKKKFKDENSLKLVRRIIVGEMDSRQLEISGDETKDTATVESVVNEMVDKDDDLKELVSEMDGERQPPVTSRTDRTGGQRELKPGFANSNIRVKAMRR